MTARETAVELLALRPGAGWTEKRVEHLVRKVRHRLADEGEPNLRPEPGRTGFDSAYRRNLIEALLRTGTLGPGDLHLLEMDD